MTCVAVKVKTEFKGDIGLNLSGKPIGSFKQVDYVRATLSVTFHAYIVRVL